MTAREKAIIAGYQACIDAAGIMLDAVKQVDKTAQSVARLVSSLEGQIQLFEDGDGKDEILSVAQAAERLQVTRAGLYGLVHKKAIPYMKVGKTLRFSSKDLDSWMRRKPLTQA